jgi:DNA-binding YbaB/EbfC family protein
MAKGGFPGGMGNLMKQAQQLQEQMRRMQEDLEQRTVEASAGGGMVKVVVNGKKELIDITIDPAAVDPEDVDMLQDLVLAAVNEGIHQADEMYREEMGRLTGGLNIPGMF